MRAKAGAVDLLGLCVRVFLRLPPTRPEVCLAERACEVAFMHEDIIVLKLGSSVLETQEDLPDAVHEIYRWYRAAYRVVAVVSAIGDTTDHLIAQAGDLAHAPDPWSCAELLATGERASAALLGVALDRSGVPARIVDPREIGLTVAGGALDSEPVSLDANRLKSLLTDHPVVIIPGFFGTASDGRVHLLGRGGSDLSAVFLANRLGAAQCRLVKDVDGIYEADPALIRNRDPHRFAALSHGDALRVAGGLIQPKAVSYLQTHGRCADVAARAVPYASRVHAGPTHLACASNTPPLRVLMLGLGTVGFGVYHRLIANPEHFQVEAALVRNPSKYLALGVAADILLTTEKQLSALQSDLVIDALPGVDLSRRLVERFLSRGADVVSANKRLIAEHGPALGGIAERAGARLQYAAAVGGSTPMIEAIDIARSESKITELAAVLNGTCNFILDRCAAGASLVDALAEAKAAGFAEQDPTDDLEGKDAERKLRVLCRHAFGNLPEALKAAILDERVARKAALAGERGMRLRQVARAAEREGGLEATIDFEELHLQHPLGSLTREWNGLEISSRAGSQFVRGRGAGRWPTTESLMADAFDVRRLRWARHVDNKHLVSRAILR
jgi:homoserine dehydrogenase